MPQQTWTRDRDQPCIALGAAGAFDDTHVFAPCVAYEHGRYLMWYPGSRGAVKNRVFQLGFATSADGIVFEKHAAAPVFRAGGGRSVLTPTLLRNPQGDVRRECGRLRMWFAACDFPSGDPRHTLHETSSVDGINWTPESPAQLENLYAPTILYVDGTYKLWFTNVAAEPWSMSYAASADGRNWRLHPEPVLQLDQAWEHSRLFYPTVVRGDHRYWMWYGSYTSKPGEEMRTALGFAVSDDGIHWHKHPDNPVFGPQPKHSWESNFTTSQSLLKLPDGSWRIWYAARCSPPTEHKYFAIGTARGIVLAGNCQG